MILSAVGLPIIECSARYTAPAHPRPINSPIRYELPMISPLRRPAAMSRDPHVGQKLISSPYSVLSLGQILMAYAPFEDAVPVIF
jgi:hypothetical protein